MSEELHPVDLLHLAAVEGLAAGVALDKARDHQRKQADLLAEGLEAVREHLRDYETQCARLVVEGKAMRVRVANLEADLAAIRQAENAKLAKKGGNGSP